MKFHNTLNPKLWDKEQEKGKVAYYLKKDVAAKLKEIANAFIKYLDVDKEAIKDVVITGSSASFNYTSHSDLDLHLKVDYDLIHEDCPIVEGYLWALKATFNKDHDISIYGIPVEVYAESIDSDTVHNGLFSLWNMKWIDEPKPIPPTDNDMAVKAKYEEIKEAADRVKDSEVATQLINKIYEMRKAGLQEVGEFSTENLAFKKLRDAGVLERLKAMKKEKVDKELSLESYNEGLAPATGDLAVFTKRLFGLNLKPDKNFIRQTDYKLDLEHADTYIKKDIGYDCPGIVYQIRDKQDNIIKEVKWTDIYNTSEEYDKTINYLYKYGSMQEIAYVLKLANPNASEDTINKKLQELQTHRDKSRRIKSHMYFDGNTWQNESINKLEETLKKAQDKELSLESYNESDNDLTNFCIIIDGEYNWLEEYGTFKSCKAAQEWLDKNGEEGWMYSQLTKGEMKDLGIDEYGGYVNESIKESLKDEYKQAFDLLIKGENIVGTLDTDFGKQFVKDVESLYQIKSSKLKLRKAKELLKDLQGYLVDEQYDDYNSKIDKFMNNSKNESIKEYYEEDDCEDIPEEMHKEKYVTYFETPEGRQKYTTYHVYTDSTDDSYNELCDKRDNQLGMYNSYKELKDALKEKAEKIAAKQGWTVKSIENLGEDDEYYRERNKLESYKESIDTDLLKRDEQFRYMMLDRMRQDCNYYLEHPHEKHLWAGNVEDQIETMKQLYNSLPEKPEWITMEDIDDLEKQMINLKNNKNEDVNTLCDKIDNVEKDLEDMVKLVKPQVLMKNEAYNKLRKVVCEALEETEFGEFKVGSKVKIGNTWNARQGTITDITNDVATVEIEETPNNMARTDKFYLQDLQLV